MINDYFRFALFSPSLQVGDVPGNTAEIIRLIKVARQEQAALALFPELSITAYSCGDMFFSANLLSGARQALLKIVRASSGSDMVIIVGLPLRYCSVLYNCAAVIQNGRLCGIVPKSVLPNYREFYEKRHFKSGAEVMDCNLNLNELDYAIHFGVDLVFDDGGLFQLGVEICEDLWCINPPSGRLAVAGAKVIANLSATTEVVGKNDFRRNLVLQQSARLGVAYLLSSAGGGESTTDVVFAGHLLLAEHGEVVAENKRFSLTGDVIFGDVDLAALDALRCSESSFADNCSGSSRSFRHVKINSPLNAPDLQYANLPRNPFISSTWDYHDILEIQKHALIKRLRHLNTKNVVLGISGGLDSTLALLVAVESFRTLGLNPGGIHALSMPGFGTSGKTRRNAEILAQAFDGVTFREIDICEICRREFAAIGHEEDNHNVIFENVQARSRTEILMNFANSLNALVLGTGDLSEIALGWNTYNGDHMS
ncbi:MAG: NAD(+) synthase, partial [Victivallaceae bacterium]